MGAGRIDLAGVLVGLLMCYAVWTFITGDARTGRR